MPRQCSYSHKAPSRLPHSPVWHVTGQQAPRSCAEDQILSKAAPAPFPSSSDLGPAKMMCPSSHTGCTGAEQATCCSEPGLWTFTVSPLERKEPAYKRCTVCWILLEFGATSCRQNVIFTCTGFNIQHEHIQLLFAKKKKKTRSEKEGVREGGEGELHPCPQGLFDH